VLAEREMAALVTSSKDVTETARVGAGIDRTITPELVVGTPAAGDDTAVTPELVVGTPPKKRRVRPGESARKRKEAKKAKEFISEVLNKEIVIEINAPGTIGESNPRHTLPHVEKESALLADDDCVSRLPAPLAKIDKSYPDVVANEGYAAPASSEDVAPEPVVGTSLKKCRVRSGVSARKRKDSKMVKAIIAEVVDDELVVEYVLSKDDNEEKMVDDNVATLKAHDNEAQPPASRTADCDAISSTPKEVNDKVENTNEVMEQGVLSRLGSCSATALNKVSQDLWNISNPVEVDKETTAMIDGEEVVIEQNWALQPGRETPANSVIVAVAARRTLPLVKKEIALAFESNQVHNDVHASHVHASRSTAPLAKIDRSYPNVVANEGYAAPASSENIRAHIHRLIPLAGCDDTGTASRLVVGVNTAVAPEPVIGTPLKKRGIRPDVSARKQKEARMEKEIITGVVDEELVVKYVLYEDDDGEILDAGVVTLKIRDNGAQNERVHLKHWCRTAAIVAEDLLMRDIVPRIADGTKRWVENPNEVVERDASPRVGPGVIIAANHALVTKRGINVANALPRDPADAWYIATAPARSNIAANIFQPETWQKADYVPNLNYKVINALVNNAGGGKGGGAVANMSNPKEVNMNGGKKHSSALINTFIGRTGSRICLYLFETYECIVKSFNYFTAMNHTTTNDPPTVSHLPAPLIMMRVMFERRRAVKRSSTTNMLAVLIISIVSSTIIVGGQARQVSLQF
jgi:hypothetical protein